MGLGHLRCASFQGSTKGKTPPSPDSKDYQAEHQQSPNQNPKAVDWVFLSVTIPLRGGASLAEPAVCGSKAGRRSERKEGARWSAGAPCLRAPLEGDKAGRGAGWVGLILAATAPWGGRGRTMLPG